MGTLLKKLTALVKDGIIGTVSLPLEDRNHEEKMNGESGTNRAILAKHKTLLQNPNYGSRRKDEKNQSVSR